MPNQTYGRHPKFASTAPVDSWAQPDIGGHESFCWCGEKRAWFSDLFFTSCAGTGYMDCLCGGDFCVCHNHGGMECPGCDECEGQDDPWWDEVPRG